MSNIAIIPARGGSKRIPRKNIKKFLGKPIIAYSIQTAIESNLFAEVHVSTDDKEIAEIAQAYGAKVPFLRSSTNSDDFATTADVISEVLSSYAHKGHEFQHACCIYPTAPLLKIKTLQSAYESLCSNQFDTVFPVIKFSYPIWRGLSVQPNCKATMIWPENKLKRSQDLAEAWHDAGQFYWLKVKEFKRIPVLFGDNSGVIEISETEAQDIDTITDWTIAELKAQLQQ